MNNLSFAILFGDTVHNRGMVTKCTVTKGMVTEGTVTKALGLWRRVLAPAPKVLGYDSQINLKSRFCVTSHFVNKVGAMLEFGIDGPLPHQGILGQYI